MRLWTYFFILWLAGACKAEDGIRRWDALPAVDVMHLQGPYAGRTVCPMCRHGYDAGVLVFLPSTTDPASAGRIAAQLRVAAERIDDPRFRPFLILTGATPSPRLLSAVRDAGANWYVAHLPSDALPEASRDFRQPLEGRAQGYVFAQRRLLLAFDPEAARWTWNTLARYSDYAMGFLRATYARPVAGDTPDTPKGRLWLAPSRLSSTIAIAKSSSRATSRLCFVDSSRTRRGDALVALTATASTRRTWWARTDANGCVELQGAQTLPRLFAEVFSALQPAVGVGIQTSRLAPDSETEVAIHAADAVRVTGKEVGVGLPCDGCEAVFAGLPDRFPTVGTLAPPSEPGERLQVSGTVRNAAGVPQANVIVYAYQTDRNGRYPPAATRHGRLRGWARTDANGRYGFTTIRPGAYPGLDSPRHIHMHIIEPGRCTYSVGDILFTDDPLLTPARRLEERNARGGNGIARVERSKASGWTLTRDITLGLDVPGYRGCSS